MSEQPHTHADGTTHTHGDGHGHTHSHAHTKAVLNRLSRAQGHLDAVRRMVERGEDCSAVLVQLSAVISALNSTGRVILKDHIAHCIVDAVGGRRYRRHRQPERCHRPLHAVTGARQ